MQKALSLYIDSQIFEKNRLARLTLQENYQTRMKELLEKSTCPLPYYPLHDGLLLDLRDYPKITSLKHSSLKLDFFEKAYLDACPYQFAKVSLENLEELLEYLKAELD